MKEYQRLLLREFNPDKAVFFRYNVDDCDDYQDMITAYKKVRKFIESYGGTMVNSYWDGNPFGEAWIICSVPYEHLAEVFETQFFYYDPWQK